MGNELKVQNSLVVSGPASISGSLNVTGSIRSTAPASFSGSLSVTGSLNVVGGGSIIQADGDGYLKIGNNGGGTIIENYNRTDLTLKANAILTTRGTGVTFRSTKGEPNGAILGVIGSGATSSTTSLLVQNANASSSLSIKDNGDSTFFYPGVAGYSLKISGSYSGNGTSAIYETLGATGGYYGIHEFRTGFNTTLSTRAMSIVYGGRVVIGNKSDTVLQSPGANLFVDTNVINSYSSQNFNTGIIINPSGSLNTELTASGIQFNFAANNPNDTNGGAFIGSQYNPLTNGYDSDLVIYNSQGSAGSYVETARFVGKSKSLSLGAGRNPSASLHISGSSNSTLLEIDSPAVNNILFVSGSGRVGIGTGTPTYNLEVSSTSGTGFGIMSGANSGAEINFRNVGYANPRWTIRATGAADGSSGNLTFQRLASTFPVTITSNENLLVGTSIDSARLVVKGSGTTSSTTAFQVQNANASSSLQVRDDGVLLNYVSGSTYPALETYVDGLFSGIKLSRQSDGFAGRIQWNSQYQLPDNAGNIVIGSTTAGFIHSGGVATLRTGEPRLAFLSNSNSGKGFYITAPTASNSFELWLHDNYNQQNIRRVAGFSNTNDFTVYQSGSQNALLFVSGSGNVGMGTNTPSYKVQVGDLASNNSNKVVIATLNSGVNGFYVYASSNIRAGIESDYGNTLTRVIGAYNGGTNIIGQDSNNGNTILYSGISNTERARIEGSTGNVLIGTATGSARLTVKGSGATSSTTSLLVQDSSNNTSFIVQDDRKVGIGKAPTTASLHVFTPGTSPDPKIVAIFEGYVFPAQPEVKIGIGSDGSGADNYGSWFGHNVKPSSEGNFGFVQMYGAGRTLTWNSRGHVAIGTVSGSYSPNIFRIEPKSFDSNTVWDTSGIMFNVQSGSVSVITGNLNNDVAVAGFGTITLNANVTARTYTNASTVYIQGPPRAGTNTAITSSWALYVNSGSNYFRNSIQLATGSLSINTTLTGSALNIYKSGSTVVDIQGSQGQLFSVIDALSGSLMSVNDISGLPILEVFSDDRVVMGTYGAPAVIISGSNTVISGSLRGRVVTLSTASATASMDCSLSNFFDLTLSGSMYLTPTNILPGETINLRITQPATSGSLNYTSSIKFPNGLPYTASATSSVVDLISFISFDSTTLYATAIKNLV